MAHDVFISYSTKNTEYADAVCKKLEDNGIECWIAPRNIKTGTNYAKEIMDGLKLAKLVVLIFSKDAQESEYVNNEIDTAFSKNGQPIVALKVDDSFPEKQMEFFLKNSQWLDASPTALKKENKTLDSCYDQLVGDVQRILDGKTPVSGSGGVENIVIPGKEKGFFDKYKLPIVIAVILLIAVGGFLAYSNMNGQSSSGSNETGMSIGYIGLEKYGDAYTYFVFGDIAEGFSNSSSDVIHIDYYDNSGKVVKSSNTKIGDVDGNILGSVDVNKKDIVKVSAQLQDKDKKVLYSVESDNIIEQ